MFTYSQSVFLYTALIKCADALTALAVWYGCWYLRFHSSWIPAPKGLPDFSVYSRVSLPLVCVIVLVMHVTGAYRSERIQFGARAAQKVVQGAFLGTLVFVATCYFLGERDFSRVFLILYGSLLAVALLVERAVMHVAWQRWLSHRVRPLRVLLVGSGDLLQMYVRQINTRRPYPVEWVAHLAAGDEAGLQAMLDTHAPDQVVVSYPESANSSYASVLALLSEELVEVKLLPEFGRYSTFTYTAKDEWGIPLLSFNQTPVGNSDRALKRVLDFVGSATILLLGSPMFAALAIAVKLTSKGPVFFAQERVGADGTRFTIYKFRTMHIDAEKETGPVWAVKNDPRTTQLGSWLRRTSLDETPQFWNVLKGDMSLVGPRPERPEFVEQFRKEIPKYMLRHKMKSGITGWAQINGWRGSTSLNERIKHDLYYIGHWSHLFDVKILCLTLVKGFVHRHAY